MGDCGRLRNAVLEGRIPLIFRAAKADAPSDDVAPVGSLATKVRSSFAFSGCEPVFSGRELVFLARLVPLRPPEVKLDLWLRRLGD